MHTWATTELRTADFGDPRLTARLSVITSDFTCRPSSSIPNACGTWGRTQATYRFFANPSVTPEHILGAHLDSCRARMQAEAIVLCVQDTTDMNLTSHEATSGLGYLVGKGRSGLAVHSTMALSTDSTPQGIVAQHSWSRPESEKGKGARRHQRPMEEKESQRWIDALVASEAAVPPTTRMVTITDREGDIYGLFAHPRRAGSDLLIRVAHNRALTDGRHVVEAIEATAPIGSHLVEVHARPDRPGRTAELSIRMSPMTLNPPRLPSPGSHYEPITVTIILAREEHAPEGQTPIRWMLLTTLPVQGLSDAVQCLQWYSYRWMIERFHYTLKSGCTLEKLQLETAAAMQRALAVYSIVAWRLLWITHHARRAPEASCECVLEPHEWQALYCAIHNTAKIPASPPTMRQAVRWLAQLGGFLARKGDGEPGVKTIWSGLQTLDLGARMYKILRQQQST